MALPWFVKIVDGFPVIDVGALRHIITIQSFGPTSPPTYDKAGPKLQWTPLTTPRAAIDAVRGTDVIKSGQVTTQLFLTVGIYFEPGIQSNMRVIAPNGSVYVIQSVENVLEAGSSESIGVLILNCIALASND